MFPLFYVLTDFDIVMFCAGSFKNTQNTRDVFDVTGALLTIMFNPWIITVEDLAKSEQFIVHSLWLHSDVKMVYNIQLILFAYNNWNTLKILHPFQLHCINIFT